MSDYPDGYVEAHLPDYPDAPERTQGDDDRVKLIHHSCERKYVQSHRGEDGKIPCPYCHIAALEQDARLVAGFIVGWWPGLEDGIRNWDEPEIQKEHPAYQAAVRLRALTKPEGE